MKVTINGETKEFDDIETLGELMKRLGFGEEAKGIAVAVNDTVIPKGRWSSTRLASGDVVEVIHAVQGG